MDLFRYYFVLKCLFKLNMEKVRIGESIKSCLSDSSYKYYSALITLNFTEHHFFVFIVLPPRVRNWKYHYQQKRYITP